MGEEDSSRPASPLLAGVLRAREAVDRLKESVKVFYYRVMLSQHCCPDCLEPLRMVGPSRCRCVNGHVVDPTLAFQKSPCCRARLVKRACHYACASCGRVVPSRFLFDERIFDADYHRLRVSEARERKKRRIEKLRRWLADSRSGSLVVDDVPGLDGVPGLSDALDAFVGGDDCVALDAFRGVDDFDIHKYWEVIRGHVQGVSCVFSSFPSLSDDVRLDRARRFLTLVHMWHEREVRLTQYGDDLLVEAL